VGKTPLPLGRSPVHVVLLKIHVWGVYVLLFLPIVILAVLSFNDSMAIGLPWRGATLEWYRTALKNDTVLESFLNSVKLGITVAILSTTMGTLAALAVRRGVVMQAWIVQLILLPLITPGIVGGLALFMGFTFLRVPKTLFGSALIGHVAFTIPYVFLIMTARLQGVDKSLEEAAADLGANPLLTFRRVTYPLIRPAALGSALLTFLLSFDEFIRTFFLVGLEKTLPLAIWDLLFDALTPEIPALMTMLLVFNVIILLLGQWSLRR
jgi:spermidine/putrescine transport system permease protein